MTEPTWWSQPFPPAGAITSEGIRNQLGRPTSDALTIFVRESAQNSWDARTRSGAVQYALDVEEVPDEFIPAWRRLFSAGAPAASVMPLVEVLRPGLRILAVSDRGTKGMGGPTTANVDTSGPRDWISFVLNVGERRDTAGGGGTYGYGKAVYYRLSRVGTVLVSTRTAHEGRLTTRLIGIGLGESYTESGVPYTGRHWWGDPREDYVEPLVDGAAEAVLRELGIPLFDEDDTGTTIIVVDPDFGDIGVDQEVALRLADTIAWHLWPLILPERGSDRLDPIVTCRGIDYPVPDPARTYPLDMFVRAYQQVKAGQSRAIESRRPHRLLGALGLQRRAVTPGHEGAIAAREAGVDGDPHHVCLLRMPELVVTYLVGPEPFSAASAYAGVFRVEDDLDDTFARSEPPTHDDWVADQMTGHEKTYVRQAKLKVLDALKEFVRPASPSGSGSGLPLGAASNFLGSLVAVSGGGGAGFSLGGGTGSGAAGSLRARPDVGGAQGGSGEGDAGRPRSVRALLVGDPTWEPRDDALLLAQRVALPRGTEPVVLTGLVGVRTADGARESEPPAGADLPEVVGWEHMGRFVAGASVLAEPGDELILFVRPTTDAVIDIEVAAVVAGSDA